MSRLESWLLHLSTIILFLTGAAYFWMKYLMPAEDPFSVVNHPWQPAMLKLHLLAAPFLVFALGVIFHAHIAGKLHAGGNPRRRSGLASLWSFVPMVLSGCLLQVVSNPGIEKIALWLHWISGSLFAVTY